MKRRKKPRELTSAQLVALGEAHGHGHSQTGECPEERETYPPLRTMQDTPLDEILEELGLCDGTCPRGRNCPEHGDLVPGSPENEEEE